VKTFDFGRSWRVTPVDPERDMAGKLCGIAADRAGRMQRLIREISMSLWTEAYSLQGGKRKRRGEGDAGGRWIDKLSYSTGSRIAEIGLAATAEVLRALID